MFEIHEGDARSALAATASFLESRPIEHNVLWQVLKDQTAGAAAARYWWVSECHRVVGAAMEVPIGARASLTPMPAAAARSLAASVMPPLAGVYADAATASAFAAQWATAHRVVARPLDAQLLYELSHLRPARRATSGVLRRAAESERSLLLDWTRAFFGNGMRNPEAMVERDLAGGHLWVWETSHAVAMARVAPAVGGVARIYSVYAPQENRGQGYGTALVESLSRLLLEAGLRCSLTVRLNNPIANGIYARIGYQPVRELLTFAFGEARHAPSGPPAQPPVQL